MAWAGGARVSLFFEVPGEPVGKARARTFVHRQSGRVVSMTPAKTKAYEESVRLAFYRAHSGQEPIAGPVALEIYAFFGVPASWSRKRKDAALAGGAVASKRPDWDNIGKSVSDALNGVAYLDDSQIVDASVQKRYASRPRVEVSIVEVRP